MTEEGCPCGTELARIETTLIDLSALVLEQNGLLKQLADHVLGRTTTEYRAALLADLRKGAE